jgi:hypothetical protein
MKVYYINPVTRSYKVISNKELWALTDAVKKEKWDAELKAHSDKIRKISK